MRTFKFRKEQINELLNSDLMFSTETSSDYCGSEVSTTEPVGDSNYGDPMTSDDKEKNMAPSPLSRMTHRGNYGGPVVY